MQVRTEMCTLRLTGSICYDCTFRLVPHTYWVLMFMICAVYCIPERTFNINSEFPSTDSRRRPESNKAHFLGGLRSEEVILQNGTWKSWNSTSGYKNESMDNLGDYDPYEVDYNLPYVGPDVIVDLGPEELILSTNQQPQGGKRKPVKDGFVWEQKMELLRLHNMYRSNVTPPAADMNFMEWDEYLSKAAQDWANTCRFAHAFPPYVEPGSMGQNLYMGHDPTGVRALLLWNEEYQDYDIKTLDCVPGKQCGHYTQLAWGDAKHVGCGMKRCAVKRFYVVCHYSPIGNIAGRAPYNIGKPCSQCRTTDGGLCTNNKCVTKEQCKKSPEKCEYECPLKCRNCGTLDEETCTCVCSDGWDSLDCSRPCRNAHDRCGKNPGWPSVTSCPMNHHAVADTYCRKMCGKCYGVESSDPDRLCCNGTVCPDGHFLTVKKNGCTCNLLCPGPLCHIIPDYELLEVTEADGASSQHLESTYKAFTLSILISASLISSFYVL